MAAQATGVRLRPCRHRNASITTSRGLRVVPAAPPWGRPVLPVAADRRGRTSALVRLERAPLVCRCGGSGRLRMRTITLRTRRRRRGAFAVGAAAAGLSREGSSSWGTGVLTASAMGETPTRPDVPGTGAALTVAVYGCGAGDVSGPRTGTMASDGAVRGVASTSGWLTGREGARWESLVSSSMTR